MAKRYKRPKEFMRTEKNIVQVDVQENVFQSKIPPRKTVEVFNPRKIIQVIEKPGKKIRRRK